MKTPFLAWLGFLLCRSLLAADSSPSAQSPSTVGEIPVSIRVNAGQSRGELTPIWRFFGYDEANYTYMKDGKKLLAELGQLGSPQVYVRWGELAFQWTKHCVAKYGRGEVEKWYWEVWNEPNISYWRGSHEDYYKLYDYAVGGVRRALPTARVGGPETAGGPGGKFLRE